MVKSTSKTKTSGAAGVLKQKKAPDTPKSEEPRHLYLMRHGKSAKAKKKAEDALRPLGKRGRKDVKKIRNLMREKHVQPDLILCSPCVRTMETLKKLRKAFVPTEVVFVDALYMADAEEMMHILRQMSPEKHEVLVIGHNPGLQDFLPMICEDTWETAEAQNHRVSEGFPTAALACLEIMETWQQLGSRPVRLMNFIYSSDL